MTIAEQLLAKGVAEGVAEGRAEGRTHVLRKQLTLKFGELPLDYQTRLANATPDEFDVWVERVLFAASLAEVFAE